MTIIVITRHRSHQTAQVPSSFDFSYRRPWGFAFLSRATLPSRERGTFWRFMAELYAAIYARSRNFISSPLVLRTIRWAYKRTGAFIKDYRRYSGKSPARNRVLQRKPRGRVCFKRVCERILREALARAESELFGTEWGSSAPRWARAPLIIQESRLWSPERLARS